ncbi:hypothetical protein NECAME_04315 [Necator americanus]|uniref:Uncharacterized protein n=1 Tax=Necator americanus TaxID=51031 RepID=W2SXG3_NECAM|nr:hypothetical protein NECAME_04315 [Necator americanus]ETN73317.1 hypothetical protein NECAME_04315 [Necator americanus]
MYYIGLIGKKMLKGIVYLSIPKPRAGLIQEVTFEALDGYGRYCQAHCYNATAERYQVCQPRLKIGVRSESSSGISYTHSLSSRRFLDVDLSVHPRQITVSAPFIVFACSRKLMTSSMITSLAENTRPPQSREPYVWFRVTVRRHVSQNLQVEAASSTGSVWSSSVRKAASPFDPNLIFVQAPNPDVNGGGVKVTVTILEGGMRIKCAIKCTKKDGSLRICDGSVQLHSEPALSEEDVYTSDQGALNLLGWNMRGHPAQWRHKKIFYAKFNSCLPDDSSTQQKQASSNKIFLKSAGKTTELMTARTCPTRWRIRYVMPDYWKSILSLKISGDLSRKELSSKTFVKKNFAYYLHKWSSDIMPSE